MYSDFLEHPDGSALIATHLQRIKIKKSGGRWQVKELPSCAAARLAAPRPRCLLLAAQLFAR